MRRLGVIPDLGSLQPGDLLLVSSISPTVISKAVTKFQKIGGYPEEHARWHHAAVYLGNDYVCEATATRGIVQTQIYKYLIGAHLLRFRRVPMLNVEQRYQLAIMAMTRLGDRYGHANLLNLAGAALEGFWNQNFFSRPKRLVCSELFSEAYTLVTRRILGSGEVTPAFLSLTSNLDDVKVNWLTICPSLDPERNDIGQSTDRSSVGRLVRSK